MSDSRETTTDGGGWDFPRRTPGSDDLWDRLGDEWQAIAGVQPNVGVYVRWNREGVGRPRIAGLCITAPSVTADTLRSIPVGRIAKLTPMTTEQRKFLVEHQAPPLVRNRGDDPEEFAERVALYYSMFSAASSRPAKEIAEHSGVPVGTVRGWIREARLRGKLPPGTKGKAG